VNDNNKSKLHSWKIKRRLNSENACYCSVLLSKNLILPVVLYGCEISSLTLRQEQRLRVFGNRVLRRIFGSKREEVAGGWRRLHNEELHNLYCSPNIIKAIKSRRMILVGHVVCMGNMSNAYKFFAGKPDGKRPLRRPRHRWENNIRMDFRETGLDSLWTGCIWLRKGTSGRLL
jgi:hypothetical protein